MNDLDEYLINFLNQIKQRGSNNVIQEVVDFLKSFEKEINADPYFITKYMTKNKDYLNIVNYFLLKNYMKTVGKLNRFFSMNKLTLDETRIKKYFNEMVKLDEFFCHINYNNGEYFVMFQKYKDDASAFIYLDPPYLSSDNSYYFSYGSGKDKKVDQDKFIFNHTKVYIDILNFLKTGKCKVLMIINKNAIIEFIFKDYIKEEYLK